jgi:hypothetical protein
LWCIANCGKQGAPICEAVIMHVDHIVLSRRATHIQIAMVQIVDRVVARAKLKHGVIIIWSTPKLIITRTAVQDVGEDIIQQLLFATPRRIFISTRLICIAKSRGLCDCGLPQNERTAAQFCLPPSYRNRHSRD